MPKLRIFPAMLVVVFLSCIVIGSSAQSTRFTSLASFNGTDGATPYYMSLVQGTDGNLYGTTAGGGDYGSGTVFRITPTGTLTTLHSFDGADGGGPYAGLVQGTDGNFYGTTYGGGDYGAGTVFRITPDGTLTTLHSFVGGSEGSSPYAPLVQASDGNFYGTTLWGGGGYGYGTVFKMTPVGTLTTLHSFNGSDGAYPYDGLVQGSDGNFYGTTSLQLDGFGTVFKITAEGDLSTLYIFDEFDGAEPHAALVQGSDGNFYGTTLFGGNNYCYLGCGTVFKITPEGTLTTLYSFCDQYQCEDPFHGAGPYAALVQASDGNFYGTTLLGVGDYGAGTVFRINPSGTLTTAYIFHGADGSTPYGGLVQAADGNLYGTTAGGGDYGLGTVFRLGLVRNCAICRP